MPTRDREVQEEPKLKSCPFCGTLESGLSLAHLGIGYSFYVECICGSEGPYKDTAEEGVAAWNTRIEGTK